MKAAAFEYVRPINLADALAALNDANGTAKVIAGGQSLGPMLNLRLARPALLVDIAGLPELSGVEDRAESWFIGAATTHADLEDGLLGSNGMIPFVARGIAFRSVRNRGTIGGSLAHADPAADWPLALSALGAIVHIIGPSGPRQVSAIEFMVAPFETVLRETELVVAIEIPKSTARTRWGYFKHCRKIGEFAEASAAIVFDQEKGRATVVMGALEGPPRALPQVAQQLIAAGTKGTGEEQLVKAIEEMGIGQDSIAQHLHIAALRRAISQAFAS